MVSPLQVSPASITIPKREIGFISFIFSNPFHQWILIISVVLLAGQFILLHSMFPFPNLMMDSYGYMEAAMNNSDIAMRPVGYSKFLHYCSFFTRSGLGLVLFQFVFVELSIFVFIFTLLYLIGTGRVVTCILFGFAVLNPIWFFLSNFVAADAIFTGLSLLWFSTLLGMLRHPKLSLIWMHAVLLFLLFTIRYNAMFYPLISVLAFCISAYKWRFRIIGFSLGIFLIGLFVWNTGSKFKHVTGKRQLSVFGGWQMASNAIYMYYWIGKDKEPVPGEFGNLHREVKKHVSWLRDSTGYKLDMAYFMWLGPLSKFAHIDNVKETEGAYFKRFCNVSGLYQSYGQFLVKAYPLEYLRFYLLNNATRQFAPPIEILGHYYTSREELKPLAKKWFRYNGKNVKAYAEKINILNPYPYIAATINVLFLIGIIGFFMFSFSKSDKAFRRFFSLVGCLWLVNAGFSILASPVVLRYQLFVVVVIFSFTIVLLELLIKEVVLLSAEDNVSGNFDPNLPVIEPSVHATKE